MVACETLFSGIQYRCPLFQDILILSSDILASGSWESVPLQIVMLNLQPIAQLNQQFIQNVTNVYWKSWKNFKLFFSFQDQNS